MVFKSRPGSSETRWGRLRLGLLTVSFILFVMAIQASAQTADNPSLWETWHSDSYSLAPRESFQIRVSFADLPLRRWKLAVDGGDQNCDLSVLRVRGEELVYYKTDESLHEVSIPWGEDEELILVLTNRNHPASFVVTFWGPPKDQVTAAYSYHVNRALEAFAAGQRLEAEDQCVLALKQNPQDAVAKVLYAGFKRDRQFLDHAAVLIEEALAGDLPEDMRNLAESMQAELVKLRAPLPASVIRGLAQAERDLEGGAPESALDVTSGLLDGQEELDGHSRSRLLTLKGRALEALGRDYEAVDAFTHALGSENSRENQAVVYFHMGRLFHRMDNLAQARGAFSIALKNGLPSGLDLQARELLKDIEKQLADHR